MQKTVIIGNIGNQAVARQNGQSMFLSFTVAVNERYKTKEGEKRENTTWYNCTYNVKSDQLVKFLTKGTSVYLEGKLQPKLYTDRNGKEQIDLSLYVNELSLLSVKEDQPEAA